MNLAVKRLIAALLIAALAAPHPAGAAARIKDIADFESVRDNQLVGYGLVVGLKGTGDTLRNSTFTRESLESMLQRLGVNVKPATAGAQDALNTYDVAAVMVTATLPAYFHQGAHVDVNISAMGDASSLLGGTLLVTPLMGADGEVYTVAQGSVTVGGYSAQGAAQSIVKGVPTSGRIANGGIVEREIGFNLSAMQTLNVELRNPDFTTARRIAQAINAFLGTGVARPTDPGTVHVTVPAAYANNAVALITDVEQLRVEPDQVAKVVIDEISGTIVMGEHVRISTVAIAQGNLTIRITETPQVSQPGAFAPQGAQTTVVPRTTIQVDEGADRKLAVMPSGVTVQELVNGLNALGIGPRDMITILQAIKAAGALQAEIQVM